MERCSKWLYMYDLILRNHRRISCHLSHLDVTLKMIFVIGKVLTSLGYHTGLFEKLVLTTQSMVLFLIILQAQCQVITVDKRLDVSVSSQSIVVFLPKVQIVGQICRIFKYQLNSILSNKNMIMITNINFRTLSCQQILNKSMDYIYPISHCIWSNDSQFPTSVPDTLLLLLRWKGEQELHRQLHVQCEDEDVYWGGV